MQNYTVFLLLEICSLSILKLVGVLNLGSFYDLFLAGFIVVLTTFQSDTVMATTMIVYSISRNFLYNNNKYD